MTYGVTTSGFVLKTLPDILTDTQARMRSLISPFLAMNPEDALTQHNGITAGSISEIWEELELCYNSAYLTASGAALDLLRPERPRIAAQVSAIYDYAVTTDASCTITAGSAFNSTIAGAPTFYNNATLSLSGAGVHLITLYTTDNGNPNIDPASLKATMTGVPSVSHLISGTAANSFYVAGTDAESDPAYRVRLAARSNINVFTAQGIENGIWSINNALIAKGAKALLGVKAIANDKGYAVDGQPAHSVQVVVYYARVPDTHDTTTETDVATAIAKAKPAGIQTCRTTDSGFIKDVVFSGQTYTIEGGLADEKPVYVTVNTSPALTPDQQTVLKANIKAWGDAVGLGNDVVVYGADSLSEVLNSFITPQLFDYEIFIGLSSSPTADDNIDIADIEVATFSLSNIVIGDL